MLRPRKNRPAKNAAVQTAIWAVWTACIALAAASPDVPAPGDSEKTVVKVPGIVKQRGETDTAPVDYSQGGRRRWTVLQRRTDSCRAVAHGNRPATDGRRLKPEAFHPISPPSIAAALGLATIGTPDEAGWCLSAGRRCLVKPTGGIRDGATLAYESWASAGWFIGVAPEAPVAARVLWDAGNEPPLELQAALARAIETAPNTGAWIVAGRVAFSHSLGQGLHISPTRQPRNARFDPQDAKRSLLSPTESDRATALIVACVASNDTPVGAEVLRRFLSEGSELSPDNRPGAKWLAHFALLEEPALPVDPSRAFGAIWDEPITSEHFPKPATLRRALDGCHIARALLDIWAIQTVEPYRFPDGDDLVDVTTLDDTLIVDHQWARPNPLLDHALVRQGRVLLRRPVAKALVRVHRRLKEKGLRLKLYDGYRPFSISQTLYRKHPYATYLARPEIGSRHNRAAAVDCTLTDADGNDLEMPSPVLTFSVSSDRLRENMSPQARRHLDLLTEAMAAEGFTTIKSEWWHYDGPDWENYPVLNVPLADAIRTRAPAPPSTIPEAKDRQERPLIPSEPRIPSRTPFDRPSDTPLPDPGATYRREEVGTPPTPTQTSQPPLLSSSSTAQTGAPILPLPVLIGIWIAVLVVLLALLFFRPRAR